MDQQFDISSIKNDLDHRFNKIIEYCQTILDLKISSLFY